MRLDNSSDNREPHTHTLGFCREKWIKDALEISSGYAGAGVADPNFYDVVRKIRNYANFTLICVRFGYCFYCIDNQIQNDLL